MNTDVFANCDDRSSDSSSLRLSGGFVDDRSLNLHNISRLKGSGKTAAIPVQEGLHIIPRWLALALNGLHRCYLWIFTRVVHLQPLHQRPEASSSPEITEISDSELKNPEAEPKLFLAAWPLAVSGLKS